MALAPDVNVKPPVQEVPKHSILDYVVTDQDGFDPNTEDGVAGDRWQGGFAVLPEPCTQPGFFEPCSTGDDREKDLTVEERDYDQRYDPFVAYVPYECTAAGFDREDYGDKILDLLDAGFAKAVERAFWADLEAADDESVNDVLTGSNADLSPRLALASLSQGLADCANGTLGAIHAPAGIVQLWIEGGALWEDENGRLRTVGRGDYVIAGAGYEVETPVKAYATGLIEVRLGVPFLTPDNFSEAFDRGINKVVAMAERVAAVTHSGCCLMSVTIDPS